MSDDLFKQVGREIDEYILREVHTSFSLWEGFGISSPDLYRKTFHRLIKACGLGGEDLYRIIWLTAANSDMQDILMALRGLPEGDRMLPAKSFIMQESVQFLSQVVDKHRQIAIISLPSAVPEMYLHAKLMQTPKHRRGLETLMNTGVSAQLSLDPELQAWANRSFKHHRLAAHPTMRGKSMDLEHHLELAARNEHALVNFGLGMQPFKPGVRYTKRDLQQYIDQYN